MTVQAIGSKVFHADCRRFKVSSLIYEQGKCKNWKSNSGHLSGRGCMMLYCTNNIAYKYGINILCTVIVILYIITSFQTA